MTSPSHIAREISYARTAASWRSRAVVRLVENAGGRLGLIRRAIGYERDVARGEDFWAVMCRRYDIGLDVIGGALEDIPRQGPLVIVANHPFGILDGLAMGRILSERRAGDFKIMAHSVLDRAPELRSILLPVDFSETRDAAARNLATRAEALRYLGGGGAIGIFPGGTVSTAPTPFGPALDPTWRSFTAKLATVPDSTVIPIYFEGANSRLFQVASHIHYALRLGLLIPEFRARVGTSIRLVVGRPIPRHEIDAFGRDARGLMTFLRQRTYALSPDPVPVDQLGYEFETKYRKQVTGHGSSDHMVDPGTSPASLA